MGQVVKNKKGEVIGTIEESDDELAECIVGMIFKAAFFFIVLPFYGTLGAIALIGKNLRFGCTLCLLTLTTWVAVITFYLINSENVGVYPYVITRIHNEGIMNALMWIWGLYNFVIQPAIIAILGVFDEKNES